jgi:hypothetical protein
MQNNSPTCLEESNNESYVPHELRGPHGYFNSSFQSYAKYQKMQLNCFVDHYV